MSLSYIFQTFKKNAVLLVIAIGLFSSCKNKKENDSIPPFRMLCSVSPKHHEKIIEKDAHVHKIYDDISVITHLGYLKSTQVYHSAPQSILLTGDYKYAFGTTISQLKPDQFFRVSVWRKDPDKSSSLIVSGGYPTVFYIGSNKVVEIGENGWEKILLEFEVPPGMDSLTLYTFLAVSDSAYFDDFTIEQIPEKEYTKFVTPNNISLHFTEEEMQRFQEERVESFKTGIHFSRDTWEKGMLASEKNVIPVKARLKGDWLDHMQGAKWSFRVKTRKNKTFKRMEAFSLQTPESRYHLHEFLSHQLFLQEGLLTTRYDFAPLYINSKSRGIYAIEEHFSKQLLEYNLRREGPLLKFDENPKWRNAKFLLLPDEERFLSLMPEYKVSRILPFSASKVISNPTLKPQLEIAHSLLFQYKNRLGSVDEIFDVDKTAKFLALTDLINGKHGITWHNQRFYYNPINCKIELINYDNFTDLFEESQSAYAHILSYDQEITDISANLLYLSLFTSDSIVKKYIHYLEMYTEEAFINTFYDSQKKSIEYHLELIQQEFPDYHLDRAFLLKNAKSLSKEIPELKKKLKEGYFEGIKLIDKEVEITNEYRPSIIPYFVNAYYSENDLTSSLRIENYNPLKINLLYLADNSGKSIYTFDHELIIDKFQDNHSSDTALLLPKLNDVAKLVFQDLDSNNTFATEITPWKKNTEKSPYQKLIVSHKAKPEQLFEKRGDTLHLKTGKYQLTERIFIPENRTVIFEAGAVLDMTQKGAIISHSALQMKGSEDFPIRITSSDFSSNGIVVLQASKKSVVNHTVFSNLNTLNYDGWTLSGAVNFYESAVEINHSTFEHNQCEDALNIIRSDFKVNKCRFLDIYADAFDSDFCTGVLSNSLFDRVGNDAIDFSTSQIRIEGCTITNIQDKGISGGEGSTLWVKNTQIDHCNIGTASKDLSEVNLENCSISDCSYGLVLLQKKPEYGAAKIIANGLEISNCSKEFLIEKESTVSFNGKLMTGKKEKVAEIFY